MKKLVILLSGLTLGLMLSGCCFTSIAYPAPLDIDNNVKAMKSGEACQTGFLGLVFTGDASVDAAKKDGNITKVHNVDSTWMSALYNVYIKQCTKVYGE